MLRAVHTHSTTTSLNARAMPRRAQSLPNVGPSLRFHPRSDIRAARPRRNVAATRQRAPCIDRSPHRFWHRRCPWGQRKPGPARARCCAYPLRWSWRSDRCCRRRFSSLNWSTSPPSPALRERELANTPEFAHAQRQRKKVEALFAELKNQIGLRHPSTNNVRQKISIPPGSYNSLFR